MHSYKINIDKKVLRLLGSQLYGDTPSIISELVQNAYDADAHNIWIALLTSGVNSIIVEDDGIGMTPNDINDRFRNIGSEIQVQNCINENAERHIKKFKLCH